MLPLLGVIGAGIPYLLAPLAIWLAFAGGLNVPLPTGTLWSALGS